MAIVNCLQCGTLFHSFSGTRRCPECIEAEEEALRTVVEYLREGHARTVAALAEGTGVDRQLILRWLRTNRLKLQLVPGELSCHRCHKPVESGNLCKKCRIELSREVAEQRKASVPAPVNPVRNSGNERMYSRDDS